MSIPVLSSAYEAHMRGRVVRPTHLVEFRFSSVTKRLWRGKGTLYAGGEHWEGIGDLGDISTVEYGPGTPTQNLEMTLSGIENYEIDGNPGVGAFLKSVIDLQDQEVRGRKCVIWFTCFDENWQVLDAPVVVWLGLMDKITPDYDAGRGGNNWMVRLNVEPLITDRHRATYGLLTNRDQQARWPTAAGGNPDRGLDRVALLAGKSNPVW